MLPVSTNHLTKSYGEFRALANCSLTVPEGAVFGLLGPNGAGKTTLVRLIMGFIRPTSGTASVGTLDIVRQSVEVRKQVAYLPGDARLPRHMKARELLHFFATMQPFGDFERSLQVAERLELDLRRRVAFMSTGMRQKLALASVLGPQTPVLILDEPTANLDPSVRAEVLELVLEARQSGRTVLFSSHVLSEIEEVCHTAAFLRRGELVLTQQLADLRDRHLVRGQLPGPLKIAGLSRRRRTTIAAVRNEPFCVRPPEYSNRQREAGRTRYIYHRCRRGLGRSLKLVALAGSQ